MTSEEPGMSVNAAATMPPVQDSAVAIVSLRIRHRSSSERERARASLPLMSVVPGQTNGGARRRGDAFLASGKAEPLAGGRLHGHQRAARLYRTRGRHRRDGERHHSFALERLT